MNLRSFITTFLEKAQFDPQSLASAKREFSKKTAQPLPRNSQILKTYRQLLKKKKIKKNSHLENLLRLKKTRTLSGVAPVAVLTKPYPCPGRCIYCPTQEKIPKSYLDDEPAVMRAQACGFDAYKQVSSRIKQYHITGHAPEKIELIVMGGTFTALPFLYQKEFIRDCFLAANNPNLSALMIRVIREKENLITVQKENEKAKYRIIGITLETRPDEINKKIVENFRFLGATRVEIGVQTIFDSILKGVNRGHGVKETIKATRLLKDAGFKVCYHLMPNLPGSDLKKDLQLFKKVFTDGRFKPDMIKIYPCVVTYQAKLYDWFKKGKYAPYSDKQLINFLIKIKQIVPQWVRINRLGRDIPIGNIAAGFKISNIRQFLQEKMKKKNLKCQCVRCREIKNFKESTYNLQLKTYNYQASAGEEYFLQYVDRQNRLYALCRLRFPSYLFTEKKHFLPVLQNAALIRELHTFGQALPIKKGLKKIQHQGLGKKLLKKAEKITKAKGVKKIAVIAGIGTREYYRKLDYKLKSTYMVKSL